MRLLQVGQKARGRQGGGHGGGQVQAVGEGLRVDEAAGGGVYARRRSGRVSCDVGGRVRRDERGS